MKTFITHMRRGAGVAVLSLAAVLPTLTLAAPTATNIALDRTVLPIVEPQYPPITEINARKVTPPPLFRVQAPAKAPNVLIVLMDDMGFGHPSAFGGPIRTPTAEQLANEGIRFNQFHTTSLCTPTRAALLTGRNAQSANLGSVVEVATAFPGHHTLRPNSVATVAEMLRLNGYATGAFGKYHETTPWDVSPSGPFDRWPTRSGFDKFYGFIGAEANQWAPSGIFDGVVKVRTANDGKYHLMTDMTNQAVNWVRTVKSLTPDKPVFLYFAPGAIHAPHHVPKEWIAKYKGKFDMGWDKLREQTLARQKALGVVPADTPLAPKPAAIKDWDTLSNDEKKLFTRQMEVAAAFGEYADTEIGHVVRAFEQIGQLDNTLVLYIMGDNGSSAEGGMNGRLNELTYANAMNEQVADMLKRYDDWGGPKTYGHFAAGWAVAGNTPFAWTKQVASNYGGTRNGMIVRWPARFQGKGEVRSQWHHVIDVAPTILEAAGLPEPKSVNGTVQKPLEGSSMVYAFNDAKAADRHTTQFFELFGNRAIYHEGWLAGTVHKAPWEYTPRASFENDKWELYDTRSDFSLARDLAALQPEKLKEMQALFLTEAVKYNVLPLDDRVVERLNPTVVGRPDLMGGRTELTAYPGMIDVPENVFINTKNRSFTITAEVDVGKRAHGVVLSQGGRFGGYSLYLHDGKPAFTYNWFGMEQWTAVAKQPLPAGKATLVVRFNYDGGGMGKGGTATVLVGEREVATLRVPRTHAGAYSLDEGASVGEDGGTPVSESYAAPAEFSGKIESVTIRLVPPRAGLASDKPAAEAGVLAARTAVLN